LETQETNSNPMKSPTAKTTVMHCILVDLTSQDGVTGNDANETKEYVEAVIHKTVHFCGTTSAPPKQQPPNKYSKEERRKKKDKEGQQTIRHGSGLGEEQHGADDTGKIVESILRFVQVPDKRTKFCAMLLKSYLYYHQRFRYFDDGDGDGNGNGNGHGDGSVTSTSIPPSNVPIVEEGSSIPIVILPRTQYGKPFIPNTTATTATAPQQTIHSALRKEATNSTNSDDVDDINSTMLPFNVSHQFPFVGISYYSKRRSREDTDYDTSGDATRTSNDHSEEKRLQQRNKQPPQTNSNDPLIGLDIVTFEAYNKRLYATPDKFLRAYESSFTPWEWRRIHYSDRNPITDTDCVGMMRTGEGKMREFYLRWAMKEALTKALGVGLGLDFNSFESHLLEVDIIVSDDDDDADALNGEEETNIANGLNKHGDSGIWDYINHRRDRKQTKNQEDNQTPGSIHLPALVRGSLEKEGESEIWDFVFVPLRYETDYVPKYGCACTCLGPRMETFHDTNTTLDKGVIEEHRRRILWREEVNMSVTSLTMRDLIVYHTKDNKL